MATFRLTLLRTFLLLIGVWLMATYYHTLTMWAEKRSHDPTDDPKIQLKRNFKPTYDPDSEVPPQLPLESEPKVMPVAAGGTDQKHIPTVALSVSAPPRHPSNSAQPTAVKINNDDVDHNKEEEEPEQLDLGETEKPKPKIKFTGSTFHRDQLPFLEKDPGVQALIERDEPANGTDHMDICPLCGHTEHHHFVTEKGFDLVKCDHCGFLYIYPFPTDIDPNRKTYHEKWEWQKVEAMRKKIKQYFSPEELEGMTRWIDIGAGNGELLQALTKWKHINATGLEMTDYKIANAAKMHLPVKKIDMFTLHEKFDVVTVMNVLSHVTRPVPFFAGAAALLNNKGCMWISTGNAADVPPKDNPGDFSLPDHLIFAGKNHVYTIFHRIRLKVVQYCEFKHFWHNYKAFPPSQFRAIYVKACKPDYIPKGTPLEDCPDLD
eukprot:TRINITY_DN0_c0_g1_i1.p1 TRINITY_DN0_c0_g1~~TRINITY_DN0_c0_g1_i1.p1  ORF type:complete len:433 (-),score=31.41 TRINITY_DN0_c0_g1_i1:31-1329(-)